nr:hypothetical protein [Escherichia coli]
MYLWPQEDDRQSRTQHDRAEATVLTLKRKTEGTAPVRSRKTIINVTTPPKWSEKAETGRETARKQSWAKKAQPDSAVHLSEPALTG